MRACIQVLVGCMRYGGSRVGCIMVYWFLSKEEKEGQVWLLPDKRVESYMGGCPDWDQWPTTRGIDPYPPESHDVWSHNFVNLPHASV